MFIENIDTKKIISFKYQKELHHVKLDNVMYVFKDNETDKTTIVTVDGEYPVRDPLSSIADKLDSRFYQTHRACYVNLDKIESVDFKNSIVYFNNDTSIAYLSRNYKKELRDLL